MFDHEDDDLPVVVIEKRTGAIGPFLWGAIIGAAATLMLAPGSGEQTRRDLGSGLRRLRDAADSAARDLESAVRDTVGGVRKDVETRVGAARNAFDAGKDAARGARDDIERRVHEGREAVRSSYRSGRQRDDVEAGEE